MATPPLELQLSKKFGQGCPIVDGPSIYISKLFEFILLTVLFGRAASGQYINMEKWDPLGAAIY